MIYGFAPVLLVALFSLAFVFANMFLSFVLRPYLPEQKKSEIYECGELPVGGAWVNTNIRFYVIALIFLIFEVEVAVMYPIAVVYKKWTLGGGNLQGFEALIAVLIFAGVLFFGVIYSWAKGDFEWVSAVEKTRLTGPDANVLPANLKPENYRRYYPG